MAENKKSFILYADLIHTVSKLPNDKAGELFKHILEYVNDKNPIAEDLLLQISFEPIKQQLKRDLNSWDNQKIQRSEAGKKGMEKRWGKDNTNNTVITEHNTVTKPITNITDNVTVNVNDTVTVTDNVNVIVTKKEIHIPTFLELSEFVKEKIDYYPQIENSLKLKYESWIENKWKDGNDKKIVNWKTKTLNTIQYLAKDFTKKQPEAVYKNDPSKWDSPEATQLVNSKFKEVGKS